MISYVFILKYNLSSEQVFNKKNIKKETLV